MQIAAWCVLTLTLALVICDMNTLLEYHIKSVYRCVRNDLSQLLYLYLICLSFLFSIWCCSANLLISNSRMNSRIKSGREMHWQKGTATNQTSQGSYVLATTTASLFTHKTRPIKTARYAILISSVMRIS